ncbi:MAG: hypothetical protein GY788_20945 [bacterium]|nr:hypothetical protein [bacterium]
MGRRKPEWLETRRREYRLSRAARARIDHLADLMEVSRSRALDLLIMGRVDVGDCLADAHRAQNRETKALRAWRAMRVPAK